MLIAIATLVTFILTSIMSMAGIGAAFILVPTFMAMGVEIHTAMATALLLNTVANSVSASAYIRLRLIEWRQAIPILIVAVILSPFGVHVSQQLPRPLLLSLFAAFLIFASMMMVFYAPKPRLSPLTHRAQAAQGSIIGAAAGFLGGLLGVGGGMIIMPSLIGTGMDPKRASATSSFIIIFASFTGFLAHASLSDMDYALIFSAAIASATGAKLGSWLMTNRMQSAHLKKLVSIILFCTAIKMIIEALSS